MLAILVHWTFGKIWAAYFLKIWELIILEQEKEYIWTLWETWHIIYTKHGVKDYKKHMIMRKREFRKWEKYTKRNKKKCWNKLKIDHQQKKSWKLLHNYTQTLPDKKWAIILNFTSIKQCLTTNLMLSAKNYGQQIQKQLLGQIKGFIKRMSKYF